MRFAHEFGAGNRAGNKILDGAAGPNTRLETHATAKLRLADSLGQAFAAIRWAMP